MRHPWRWRWWRIGLTRMLFSTKNIANHFSRLPWSFHWERNVFGGTKAWPPFQCCLQLLVELFSVQNINLVVTDKKPGCFSAKLSMMRIQPGCNCRCTDESNLRCSPRSLQPLGLFVFTTYGGPCHYHYDDDDDGGDDDNDDHRLTGVIIRSNGGSRKIFTRAFVAAFAVRKDSIIILKKKRKGNLLVQVSWQGPWPLFKRHSFTSRQSPCVIIVGIN